MCHFTHWKEVNFDIALITEIVILNFKSENTIFSNEKRSSLGIKGDCTVIKKNETHLEFSEMACNSEAYFICEVGKSTTYNSILLLPLI